MADNVAVTAGSGTTIAADEVVDGTLGTVKVQYVKIMDATLDGTSKAAVGANGLKTDPTSAVAMNTGVRSATTQRVTIATDDIVPAAQSGTWTVQPGNTANTTAWKVDGSAVTQPVSGSLTTVSTVTNLSQLGGAAISMGTGVRGAGVQRVTISTDDVVPASQSGTWTVQPGNTANTTPWLVNVRFAGTAADLGSGTGGTATQRIIVDSSQIGTQQTTSQAMSTGYTLVALPTNQVWPTGMSPRAFSAAFTTLTRPANTTAYSAGDSISNNATAGSVTALSATLSDTNDDPITITEILVSSTDTGLAGKRVRAYLFNSDPTASTGVGGGDNAAFSQKVAGYIGSMSGVLETGFSDGTVGRLVPTFNDSTASPSQPAGAGGFVVTKPTTGAKTIFIQYQAMDAFTPSANSTTIIGTARGFQGRTS